MGLAGSDKDEYSAAFNEDDTAAKQAQNEDDFEFDRPAKTEPVRSGTVETKDIAPEGGAALSATPTSEPKKQSFKEAFAANRKSGNGTFEWNGKKYTTELANDKAKGAAAPAAPKSVTVADKPSNFSPVKKDNRPKVEISAPSGKMTIPAAEKPAVTLDKPAAPDMVLAPGGKRYFNADGSVKQPAVEAAPAKKVVASPVRTSSPMRG